MFLPADFEGGGGHGGELGGDVEDAVEFAVGKGLGYGCGDAGYDSAVSNPLVLHVPLVWRGGCREQYLVLPNRTSATPYSSPKDSSMSRKASKARPSSRMFSRSAWRTNARSLRLGSVSRGMLIVVSAMFCADL